MKTPEITDFIFYILMGYSNMYLLLGFGHYHQALTHVPQNIQLTQSGAAQLQDFLCYLTRVRRPTDKILSHKSLTDLVLVAFYSYVFPNQTFKTKMPKKWTISVLKYSYFSAIDTILNTFQKIFYILGFSKWWKKTIKVDLFIWYSSIDQ